MGGDFGRRQADLARGILRLYSSCHAQQGRPAEMKATIIVADAVTFNPDGTFSLLRGGIDRVFVPEGRPCTFQGGVVVRFTASASEIGTHEFKISCVNEDGISVGLEASGNFEIKEMGGAVVAFNLQLIFPKPGTYHFTVSADRHELDTYALRVTTGPMPPMSPRLGHEKKL